MSFQGETRIHFSAQPYEPKETGVESIVGWLKTATVVDLRGNIVVQPVTNETEYSLSCLCIGLVSAWTNPVLRQGYLPTTSSDFLGAEKVVKKWMKTNNRVVYIYGPESTFEEKRWSGYLTLELEEDKKALKTEWTYGLFYEEFSRLGYTTKAVAIVLKMVEEACYTFGCPLKLHSTTVSDLNMGSQTILRKNQFNLTSKDTISFSPIRMGGKDLEASKNPELSLPLNKYSLW